MTLETPVAAADPSAHSSQYLLKGVDPYKDPVRALVVLWLACDDTSTFNLNFNIVRNRRDALRIFHALDYKLPLPDVPALAALRGFDEFLYSCLALSRARKIVLDDKIYMIIERPKGWKSTSSLMHGNHIEYWMNRHQVVPMMHRGIHIECAFFPANDDRLRLPLTAWVGGFDDKVKTSGIRDAKPKLSNSKTRASSAVAALELAKRHGAQLVVFPELTVDATVLKVIKRWLSEEHKKSSKLDKPLSNIVLVAAGSFYESKSGETRSVSYLLNNRGHECIRHVKLQPMRYGEHIENIVPGTELFVLNSTIGMIAVAICLDFCDSESTAMGSIWSVVGPRIVLIPSMSGDETLRAHGLRARVLRRKHGTNVFVASQADPDHAPPITWSGRGTAWIDGVKKPLVGKPFRILKKPRARRV